LPYERWQISPKLEQKMREVPRQLRRDSTQTEDVLWQKLRDRQLGHKFRRQTPIGPFVVDFLCAEAHLVIEVDGLIHATQQQADQERQILLESLGLLFLRFSTQDVTDRLHEVLDSIRVALDT
jgi:very-short-patch-repair endonuclease